jgi:hypothetical protein
MAETDTITIQGETFTVVQPYEEGHVINANEAQALNQTFAENVRNNFAKRVKDAKEAGSFVLEQLQATLDEYMEKYSFGTRVGGGGGGRRDPVLAEAISIALDKIKDAIKKGGGNVSDYDAKDLRANAKVLAERTPEIMEAARETVKRNQAIAATSLDDIMANLQTSAPSEAPTEGRAAA